MDLSEELDSDILRSIWIVSASTLIYSLMHITCNPLDYVSDSCDWHVTHQCRPRFPTISSIPVSIWSKYEMTNSWPRVFFVLSWRFTLSHSTIGFILIPFNMAHFINFLVSSLHQKVRWALTWTKEVKNTAMIVAHNIFLMAGTFWRHVNWHKENAIPPRRPP